MNSIQAFILKEASSILDRENATVQNDIDKFLTVHELQKLERAALHHLEKCRDNGDLADIDIAGFELIIKKTTECNLVAVFYGVMNAFLDKNSILWMIGTFSDGTTRPLTTSEYAATASVGTVATTTTTVDQPIPGSSVVLPAGTPVYTYSAPGTVENVTFSFTGLANGVVASDLVVDFVAEPVTLTSAAGTISQPDTI